MLRARSTTSINGLGEWRIRVLLAALGVFAVALVVRLFVLQVLQTDHLASKAEAEHTLVRKIVPARGTITDQKGVLLAANRNADRLFAEPRYIQDPAKTAAALAPILKQPADVLQRKLTGDGLYVSLAARLTPEQSDAVRKLDIVGLGLDPEPARVYPNGSLGSHLLGFANFENVGSYGIEGQYNGFLTGEPGQIKGEQDSSGKWLAISQREMVPAKSGANVVTTIDSTIQYFAEDVLKKTVREQKAKGGTIIVMDPATGAILAMASAPDFAPEFFNSVSDTNSFVNPAIGNMYEPGSTFKIITMAAGLAEGVITPDTRFNDPGYLNVYGYTVTNWDGKAHPNESMTEVLMNSANVGAAYVSNKVGKDAFYRRLQDFGFGSPTGIDLQGESGGMLILPTNKSWSPINLYTNAYGQGIGVTPLQLITAEAAVANGGLLMRPYVVSKVIRDGKVVKENGPTVVRRVLKPEVAATLKGMMQQVVEQGEYQVARMPGYTVGGKTGTASIPTKRGYDPKRTIASFVGYSPVANPKFIALIKIDEPRKSPWGSEVAAPAFKELAHRIYAYLDIPPDKPVTNGELEP